MALDSFRITAFDLALLRRLKFSWGGGPSSGAVAVDPNAPYGSDDVLADLRQIYAEVEGYELLTDEKGLLNSFVAPDGDVLDAEDYDRTLWIHDRNMVTVLEILQHNLADGISEGHYLRRDPRGKVWTRIEG